MNYLKLGKMYALLQGMTLAFQLYSMATHQLTWTLLCAAIVMLFGGLSLYMFHEARKGL